MPINDSHSLFTNRNIGAIILQLNHTMLILISCWITIIAIVMMVNRPMLVCLGSCFESFDIKSNHFEIVKFASFNS